jgi:hypothetical protein
VSNVSWAHGGGPLACLADGYGTVLARLGFTHNSVVTHVVLMGQLSRWMSEVGIAVGDLTDGRVEDFFDARRAGGQRRVPTARRPSRRTSSHGLRAGTRILGPSCGARPPTRSSSPSDDIAKHL